MPWPTTVITCSTSVLTYDICTFGIPKLDLSHEVEQSEYEYQQLINNFFVLQVNYYQIICAAITNFTSRSGQSVCAPWPPSSGQ